MNTECVFMRTASVSCAMLKNVFVGNIVWTITTKRKTNENYEWTFCPAKAVPAFAERRGKRISHHGDRERIKTWWSVVDFFWRQNKWWQASQRMTLLFCWRYNSPDVLITQNLFCLPLFYGNLIYKTFPSVLMWQGSKMKSRIEINNPEMLKSE